jgi:hypothetical protein
MEEREMKKLYRSETDKMIAAVIIPKKGDVTVNQDN